MGTKSKFFRAFVEGQTISDGRKIEGVWIDQIVETFNPATYTPRINVEHLSGYSPEPPFNGYGSVIAVKAQTDDITIAGTVEKRKALYCQVDANDQLVALVANNQKPYPSVELTPTYAGVDKVGLIGLAFTDKPASIATESLQFSRSAPGTMFAAASEGVPLEFEAAPADPAKVEGAVAGFFAALASRLKGEPEKPVPPVTPPTPANDNAFDPAAFTTQIGTAVASSIAAVMKPVTDAQALMQAEFATLKGQLETTDGSGFSRAPASGGAVDAKFATDC
jgi:hypothetical protein